MRIHQVMQETGLSKKAIHFYIQEGLLQPETESNGYYAFSDTDIDTLKFIQQLRELDLPLKDICAILQTPDAAVFFLVNHKRKLHRKKSFLNCQYERVSELENQFAHNIPLSQLINLYKDYRSSFPLSQDVTPIDNIDAEMIAYHFFGNWMRDLELTEYRRFLYDRIQKYLIANQTKQTIAFRDYLCSLEPMGISQEYLLTRSDSFDEIAALMPEEYPTYVKKIISTVERNLNNITWIVNWRRYYHKYVQPATGYYDGEISEIMCDLSPIFNIFQKNALGCCEWFFKYIESTDGSAFKANLLKKLHGYIDIYSNHHAELIALYLLKIQ